MERELFDFIDRVTTSIMTVVLSLFLGIFRNYTFYYIVYMDSLFSNGTILFYFSFIT